MTWQDKLSCILHRKKYPFISEPMTSHTKLTFFKSLIRDACREGFKYPEIFIPLSYLNLYSWLVCPAKSVFSVVYVLVDCLTTVCLFPSSFLSEHSPCLLKTPPSIHLSLSQGILYSPLEPCVLILEKHLYYMAGIPKNSIFPLKPYLY